MMWADQMDKEERDANDFEVDIHRMTQRQKQIDFGKNTLGYAAYVQQVSR